MNAKSLMIISLCLIMETHVPIYADGYDFQIDGMYKKNYVQTPEMSHIRQVSMSSVNYSTGAADIRIPLFDIECGELRLPIYLSYNSSGVKVNEPSSWVGQNWFLHAEPMITRTPKGHLDSECTNPYYIFRDRTDYYWARMYLDNNFQSTDLMPDEYNYTLLDGGGMFMYSSRNNSYVSLPYDDIKISDIRTIIDPKGTVYNYRGGEDRAHSPQSYTTSWHASSVTAANGVDSITFKYDNLRDAYVPRHEDHITVVDNWHRDSMMGYRGGYSHIGDVPDDWTEFYTEEEAMNMPVVYKTFDNYTYSYQVDENKNLVDDGRTIDGPNYFPDIVIRYQAISEISYAGNTAIFRMKDGNLSEIIVRNEDNDIIKHFKFHYEHIRNKERWFLTRIENISADDKTISAYELTYNEMDKVARPGTRAIDFWGYNNSQSVVPSGTSLVPQMKLYTKYYVQSGDYAREEFDSLTIGGDNTRKHRKANEVCMMYGMLSSIKHPTGAEERFTWEANRARIEDRIDCDGTSEFNITDELEGENGIYKMGGLRIKEISILGNNTTHQKKVFAYGENEDGAGKTPMRNGLNYFMRTQKKVYYNRLLELNAHSESRIRTLSSSPIVPITYYNGAAVMYNTVTEYTYSDSVPVIKTVYRYKLPEVNSDCELLTQQDVWDYNVHNYDKWFTDHLNSKYTYEKVNDSYRPVMSDTYTYGIESRSNAIVEGREYRNDTNENFPDDDFYHVLLYAEFDMKDYQYRPKARLLSSETHTEYTSDGDTITTTKTYNYENPDDILMTSQTVTQGDDAYTVQTSYPSSINNGIYMDMVNRNMLAYPVEERLERNGNVISARLVRYQAQENSFYPVQVYAYTPGATGCPIGNFQSFDGNTFCPLYNLMLQVGYSQGRVISLTDNQNVTTSYNWSQNKQYPLSESISGGNIVHNRTFTYINGIGMSSETRPNNDMTSFIYDTAGRLRLIKNRENKVTHGYNYNYVSGESFTGQ